ncbi:hypothetical protein D8S78_05480 [Natrialba swarupiae]|nr:hypothetical protein [Natrialba swarupiae]
MTTERPSTSRPARVRRRRIRDRRRLDRHARGPGGTETFTIVVAYEEEDADDDESTTGGAGGAGGPVDDPIDELDEEPVAAIEQTALEASPTTLEPGRR